MHRYIIPQKKDHSKLEAAIEAAIERFDQAFREKKHVTPEDVQAAKALFDYHLALLNMEPENEDEEWDSIPTG